MISRKLIKVEMERLISLKGLVEVYEEVAAGRMQRIRNAVLQSRQFLDGLLEVFRRVRAAYQESTESITSLRPKNGKTAAVFVSANSGLYGDIVDRTFDIFMDFAKKYDPDIVILGKLGIKMMEEGLPGKLYNYYDFSDEAVDMESFQMIMRYLVQFEKIVVFYGQFRTTLTQEPVMTSVSGDAEATVEEIQTGREGKRMVTKFLFEPSMQEIVKVFEGEILASIFEQTLHESQLAKFASRMLALDLSVENVEKRLSRVKNDWIRLKHKIQNRKQLQTMSGISLWANG
jgi:ATP synthase F1 gamma subunit